MSDITAVRQSTHWSTEAKEQVRALWLEGHSAGVIAKKLNATSRSAIIGLVHRMGLGGMRKTKDRLTGWTKDRKKHHRQAIRLAAVKRNNQKPKKRAVGLGIRAPKPAQIDAAKAEYEAIKKRIAARPTPAGAKSILDLEDGDCRWPYGDGPYVFCGCKRAPGASYCQDHLILSKDSRGLAKANPHVSSARININPFGLEELSKETVAA